jgi:hypothetical protein
MSISPVLDFGERASYNVLALSVSVWVEALCVVTLVGAHARGFSYALMEKRLLAVCLVNALYKSP